MSKHSLSKQKGMSREDYLKSTGHGGKKRTKKGNSKAPWADPIPSTLRGGSRH